MLIKIIAFTITSFFAISAFSQNVLEPVEVGSTPSYNEAPVFDKEGNLYVSEPYRGPVTRITPTGESSVWAALEGANGHRILEDGNHLVCDRIRKVILKLDPNGEVIGEAASDCGGKPLRGPNDLVLDVYSGFYFTDPRNQEDSIGRVGYVDSSGKSHLVIEWVGYPNGIALRADGKVLYVANSFKNEIWSYPVLSSGKVGAQEVFAKLPEGGLPDGITFDGEGNLYVAHYGMGEVQVLNPKGELIRSLPAGQKRVSNVAFGGPEGNQLYMTGCPNELQETGFVYKLDLSEAH